MKRILLLTFILGIFISGFAQRPVVSEDLRIIQLKNIKPICDEAMIFTNEVLPPAAASDQIYADEDKIIDTRYDLQTNACGQNRIVVYDDGTIGAACTYSAETGPAFSDRGTGYNYFDGSDWGPEPLERLEGDRTGWPSYAAWGEDGEIIVSHYSEADLSGVTYSRRATKGSGDWEQFDFHAPDEDKDYVWPSMITGGINNSVVHQIALCRGTDYQGGPYQGIENAMLYSRSPDGGDNWDIDGLLFPEMDNTNYVQMSGDSYVIAAQGENNVAFTYGDDWAGLILMKSTDGGDTWAKTTIWQHPYPLWDYNNTFETAGFYGTDGSHHLAFDQSGKVHVVFGITWSQWSETPSAGYYTQYGLDGIGYWNEDRPTFSADTNALSPYGEVGTELVDDYSLIGWSQDLNGNDTIDLQEVNDPPYYGHSMSSMPQILIDEQNRIIVVYSSITEGYTSGDPEVTCRHLWCRTSPDGDLWGHFTDLTAPIPTHIIDDCVFPSIADYSDDYFYLTYQYDNVPGNSLQGNNPAPTANSQNYIGVLKVSKDEVGVSIEENNIPINDYDVLQNYPNPFSGSSTIKVNVRHTSELSLEVVNMMGQVVYTVDAGVAQPGTKTLSIDGTKLTSGVYFYTVRAGETAITKKMIVE